MSLRHAILGFLAQSPKTGYELKRHFSQTVGHFWTADQAQIYRTLSALVSEGLVAVETEAQKTRPNRQVHSILPAGQRELEEWIDSSTTLQPTREPFLVRLFFVGRIGIDATVKLLEGRIAEAEVLIGDLTVLKKDLAPSIGSCMNGRLQLATLENGLAHARAERDWAADLLSELQGGPE